MKLSCGLGPGTDASDLAVVAEELGLWPRGAYAGRRGGTGTRDLLVVAIGRKGNNSRHVAHLRRRAADCRRAGPQ